MRNSTLPTVLQKRGSTFLSGKLLGLLLPLLFLFLGNAQAQTFLTWQGANNANWNAGGSWNAGYGYAQLQWTGGGGATSNNSDNPASQWRFFFNGGTSYTLTGGQVNFFDFSQNHSWILSDASVNQNINLAINFGDNGLNSGSRYSFITTRQAGGFTFGSSVSMTGNNLAIRVSGENSSSNINFNGQFTTAKPIDIGIDNTGTVRTGTRVFFNGNNSSTYSGITTMYGGVLSISNNNALGSGLLILGNGTNSNSLAVTGTTTRSQNIQVNDGSTNSAIDVSSGQTFTLTGNITQNGSNNSTKFGKSGAGTLTVSGNSTYAGQTQIGDGVVIVSNNNGLGTNASTVNRGIDLGLNVGDVSTANNVSLQLTNGITLPQSIYVAPNTSGATRTISLSGTGSATLNNEIFIDAAANVTLNGGSGTLNVNGALVNTGGVIVSGGTVVYNGNNTYTGTTTVNGGTLQLGAANRIANTSNLVLTGAGTFSTGATTGNAETLGTLNLTGTGTIALGTGAHSINFAASNALTPWTGTALTITGWSGTAGQAGTGGRIFFGNSNTGLTAAQLAKITFSGYAGTAILLSSGELVPAGPQLAVTGTLAHGSSCVGVAATTIQYTISNTGANAAGIQVNSSNPQFVVSNLSSTSVNNGGSVTFNVTFTPSAAGAQSATITVTTTTPNGNAPSINVTGTGNAGASASVLSGATAICSGGSANLQVAITGGASPYAVVYTDGTNNFNSNSYISGSNISVTPSSTTTYALISVTDANGCVGTGNSGTPTVTIKSNVAIGSVSASVNPICNGNTTNLTANGVTGDGATVTWYSLPNGGGTVLGNGTTLNSVGAGTYYARVTGDCGSPAEASITITIAQNTFSGTGNWNDATRWSCGVVPGANESVTIGNGANATLNVNLNVSGTLTMNATSTLSINPNVELAVASGGTVNLNGQSVTIRSTAAGSGAIGRILGTLNGATNVTIERFIPAHSARAWRLLSVPTFVPGGSQTIRKAWQEGDANPNPNDNNLPGFGTRITSPGTLSAVQANGFDEVSPAVSMQRYNGTAWVAITNTNTTKLDTTGAYFLFVRGSRSASVSSTFEGNAAATTLRTRGSIYQGTQVVSAPTAFSVIGNIYPSAVNFTQLTRSNVNNVYYLWDSRRISGNVLGGYQTFSFINGFGAVPGGGSFTPNQVNTTIQSGQGFFVAATSPSASITFTENAKVSGSNNLGFRPATPAEALVKIDTRLYDAATGSLQDGNAVVFDSRYANVVDGNDAPKMLNRIENLGIQTGGQLLAIEGRQPLGSGTEVLQYFSSNLQEKSYVLEVAAQNLDGVQAVLEDRFTGTSTPVDLAAASRYSFQVTAEPGSKAADRFRLVLRGAPVRVSKPGISVSPNPVQGSQFNLQLTGMEAGRYSLRLLGMEGKAALNRVVEHPGGNSNQLVRLPQLPAGQYQLEVTNGSNRQVIPLLITQ